VAHAYLFAGPRGTGKTSSARILAKALNCAAPAEERPCNHCATCVAINEGRMIDLIEIDAASNNSVEDIRELRERVGFRPSEGRYKVYIIDEVHMLSPNAFNALLKTLEEPPPHTRFVLATTEPHKIPATVVSRCQRFDFRRISVAEIVEHLRHIAREEGFEAEESALMAIARSAQGCMRDAISLLDQMLNYGADKVTLAQVQQVLGTANAQSVAELVDALAAHNVAAGLKLIQQLVFVGASLTEFCHQVIEHLRGIMVLQMTRDPALLSDLPGEWIQQMQRQAQQWTLPQTLFAIKRFGEAMAELKDGYQPQLPLELALVEAIQGPAVATTPGHAAQPAPTAATPLPLSVVVPEQPASAPTEDRTKQGKGVSLTPPLLDSDAVQKLRAHWKEFLTMVGEQCGYQVRAAVNSIRDVAVGEHAVALAFGNNAFARDMVAKPETLSRVANTLSGFLGRAVQVECQMGDQAQLSGLAVMTTNKSQEDGVEPLVDYAVAHLGAEVVK
jgi:DNA polymerase-3 subunit gamma/tau